MKSISIITATYNSYAAIQGLVESLLEQIDKDFEWIVADGGSTDGTLEYLTTLKALDLKIIEGPDFGIYDGLNRAIKESSSDYYVVIGSDDFFYPNAISIFKEMASSSMEVDLVTCPVNYAGVKVLPRNKPSWLYGQFSYITMHSVGVLVKKSLHNKVGFYSKKYPIAADQFFILSAIKSGAVLKVGDETVGVHGAEGISSVDHVGVITEFYRVQIAVGYNRTIQTLLCCLRLLKNIRKF